MKSYFIAVDSEKDRITFIRSWLEKESCVCEHVPGVVVGNSLGVPEYDRHKRHQRYGFDLTETELGCFLAHRRCWELIRDSGSCGLVMESDADYIGTLNINTLLSELEARQSRFDMVRLFGTFENNERLARVVDSISGDYNLVQTLGDPMGAVAYVVTPEAAGQLLMRSEMIFAPVDVFMGATWLHRLRYRSVKPYPFELASFPSTIGGRNRPKQSVCQRLGIEASRFGDDLRRIAYLPFHYFR